MATTTNLVRVSLLLLALPSATFAQEPVLPRGPMVAAPAAPTNTPAPTGDIRPVAVKKSNEPPPLQALAQTVASARVEELARTNFNGIARAMSFPEQPEGQGPVYAANQNATGTRRSIIVRRMTDPERTDIVVYIIRGDTMHLFHTGPDGLLQTAVQRRRDGTTTVVSGRDVDADFRTEIQSWQTWRETYLRQLAENSRRNNQK